MAAEFEKTKHAFDELFSLESRTTLLDIFVGNTDARIDVFQRCLDWIIQITGTPRMNVFLGEIKEAGRFRLLRRFLSPLVRLISVGVEIAKRSQNM